MASVEQCRSENRQWSTAENPNGIVPLHSVGKVPPKLHAWRRRATFRCGLNVEDERLAVCDRRVTDVIDRLTVALDDLSQRQVLRLVLQIRRLNGDLGFDGLGPAARLCLQ